MTTDSNGPVWPPADMSSQPSADTNTNPPADTPTAADEPMSATERATEQVVFTELIAFITENKDADTVVVHISADEFAQTLD